MGTFTGMIIILFLVVYVVEVLGDLPLCPIINESKQVVIVCGLKNVVQIRETDVLTVASHLGAKSMASFKSSVTFTEGMSILSQHRKQHVCKCIRVVDILGNRGITLTYVC